MSHYSFHEDLIFIKTTTTYFYVIPRTRSKSFGAFLVTEANQNQTSFHLLRNETAVWMIGGEKITGHFNGNPKKSSELRTRIIHLRYSKLGFIYHPEMGKGPVGRWGGNFGNCYVGGVKAIFMVGGR